MNAALKQRLAEALAFARASTTFWQHRIPRVTTSALETLHAVAPLTRQELQRERVRLLAIGGDTRSWRTVRSTGTTGIPVEMVLDGAAVAAEALAFARHLDRLTNVDWRRRSVTHLAFHPQAASAAWRSPWSEEGVVVKWNLTRVANCGPVALHAALQNLGGSIITMMPSVAMLLLREVEPFQNLDVRPLAVVLSGEEVHDATRDLVRNAFSPIVTSHYVLAETGIAGVECPAAGGYHAASEAVFVEIDETTGEILLTTLANRALPLVRYRTGDHGEWRSEPCGCGSRRPRFMILGRGVRDPHAGRLDSIRLAKLFCNLGVERYDISSAGDETMRIEYRVSAPLEEAARQRIRNAIADATRPGAVIRVEEVQEGMWQAVTMLVGRAPFDLDGVREWLTMKIPPHAGVVTAAILGSFLDPCARTRASDIDVLVLLERRSDILEWIDHAKRLRRDLPSLSIHADTAAGLAGRAPLLVARLLDQHVHLAGRAVAEVVTAPTIDELRIDARAFAQRTGVLLWERITEPHIERADVLKESRDIGRAALDALRYRYALRGIPALRVPRVIDAMAGDPNLPQELAADVRHALCRDDRC
jgi:phenylacetate-CoA ligase